MNQPLVSIITPVYNAESTLTETILSVLNQDYQNWELLLIDDFSIDNSANIIKEFETKDNRIKGFYFKENKGAAVSRNVAIKHALGNYIAFIDADDLWKPEKLSEQIVFMQTNKIAFSFCEYELITHDGKYLKKYVPCPEFITYHQLLKANTIGCLTAIYDAKKLGKLFMPEIRKRQDYGLWLDILKKTTEVKGLKKNLAVYRLADKSLSSNKFLVFKYNWVIYRKFQGLSFLKSIYYFFFFVYYKTIKHFS